MKKAIIAGVATLVVTVMVGTGLATVSASSQDVKGESILATETTAAIEATAEEIAAFEKEALEVKGTPAVKSTDAVEATAEEITAFEKAAKK